MPAWSMEDDARLLRLWNGKGLSASQIAVEFPGRSRNAVIGRIHRLGGAEQKRARMTPAQAGKKGGAASVRKRVSNPATVARAPKAGGFAGSPAIAGPKRFAEVKPDPLPDLAGLQPLRLELAALGKEQCKFAVTAHDAPPADHRFCGLATRGGAWCPAHHRLVYSVREVAA